MRAFFLLLCLPLAAGAAEIAALSGLDCTTTLYFHRLDSAQKVRATKAEAWLRSERERADPEHAEDLQLLAMQQFERFDEAQARTTAQIVLTNLKAQPPSVQLAGRLRVMAQRYHRQNNCTAADPVYELALGMSATLLGDAHVTSVGILYDYAVITRAQRLLEKRPDIHDRLAAALAGAPALASALPGVYEELGRAYYARGDFLQSERFWRVVAGANEKQSGLMAKARAAVGYELAAALYGQGRLADGDAERAAADTLSASAAASAARWTAPAASEAAQAFKRGNIGAALESALIDLARADEQLAQLEETEARVRREQAQGATSDQSQNAPSDPLMAIKLRQAIRATEAQRTVIAEHLTVVGELYHHQGKLTEAESFYRRGYAIKVSGKSVVARLTRHLPSDLGRLLRSKGQFSEAQQLQQAALDAALPELGDEHPDVIDARSELADLMVLQGNGAGAAPVYDELTRVYRKLNRPAEAAAIEAKRAALNMGR
jgi:hypothetical protein